MKWMFKVTLMFFAGMALAQAQSSSVNTSSMSGKDSGISIPNLNWFGDFRYRYEDLYQEGATNSTLITHKLRVRMGFKANPSEDTQFDLRMATANGRTSTNQTLGNANSAGANYDFKLDRASLTWNQIKPLKVQAGRMANPFFLPGDSDLVFDSDLNFDGLSTRYDAPQFFAQASSFQVDRTTTTNPDIDLKMNSLSAGYKMGSEADQRLTIGAAIHYLAGVKSHVVLATTAGNSTTGTGAAATYNEDYRPIVVGVEYLKQTSTQPVTAFVEYVKNDAVSDENQGYLVGVKYGKLKDKGTWQLAADYRELKKDAALAAWTDSDSFGGGTNGRSLRVTAAYSVDKNFIASYSAYDGVFGIASGDTERKRSRSQLNIEAKF